MDKKSKEGLYRELLQVDVGSVFMMPIAMNTGEVSIKEMVKYGFFLNPVGILLVSLFAYLV